MTPKKAFLMIVFNINQFFVSFVLGGGEGGLNSSGNVNGL